MFGLIDCNNFYASCERVFNPALKRKPVAILSNNDGCIIARSNEVKRLGIPMGAPLFKYRAVIDRNKVEVFSANFALYGDMSNRVMSAIAALVPSLEVYSIDEAFVDLHAMGHSLLKETVDNLHAQIPKWTGIPIGVGVGATKVLAKVANHYAKKLGRPVILDTPEKTTKALQKMLVGDVWGIGRKMKGHLHQLGIRTADDFARYDHHAIGRRFSVVIQRLHSELNGHSCLELEEVQAKKEICTSRSFGRRLTAYDDICDALAVFVQVSAKKLRDQNSLCEQMCVFIHTNPFNPECPQYARNTVVRFAATNASSRLVTIARKALEKIYVAGYRYKKAGIVLQAISSAEAQQGGLFEPEHDTTSALMDTIDAINDRYGDQTIGVGLYGRRKSAWGMNQNHLSRQYTTSATDLIEVV